LLFTITLALVPGNSQETAGPKDRGLPVPQGYESNNPNRNLQRSEAPASGSSGVRQTVVQPASDQNTTIPALSPSPDITGGDVPANTEMRATLDTPLSSKTSRPGDRFTATLAQPVSGGNGVVIPAGALVEGEVSGSEQVNTHTALPRTGKLNLRFRDVVLPNGQSVALISSLVSLNSWSGENTPKPDHEGRSEPGTRGKDAALNVGAAAGKGTIAGPNFGGPLKGFAIGALAGGGYVLSTTSKYVNLPAQTGLVIRLDEPLRVE
jgi:hypothetical protein